MTSHYPAESSLPRIKLLREAAIKLFEQGLVMHPSNVAMATYKQTEHLAQYVHVFHDWFPEWAHLKYHDCHPSSDFEDVEEKIRKLSKNNRLALEAAPDFFGKSLLEKLWFSGERLKQIHFYSPETGDLFGHLKFPDRAWHYKRLSFDDLMEKSQGRQDEEKKAGDEGHWNYGIQLERLYLKTDPATMFAEYFFRDKNSDELLTITASCRTLNSAEMSAGLSSLDRIFAKYKAQFTPFTAPKTPKPFKSRKSRRTKSADYFINLIAFGDNQEEDDERQKAVKAISELTEVQLRDLEKEDLLGPRESHLPARRMTKALLKIGYLFNTSHK